MRRDLEPLHDGGNSSVGVSRHQCAPLVCGFQSPPLCRFLVRRKLSASDVVVGERDHETIA